MKRAAVHAEALANAVIGIGLSQIVLACFGVELRLAVAMNAVMLAEPASVEGGVDHRAM